MAGLFADFGQTDPDEVRKQLMQEQRNQFKQLVSGAQSKKDKAGLGLVEGLQGLGQAGAFGKTVKEHLTPTSPELDKAKAQAELVKGLGSLEGDRTSADWARRAAALAKESGDDATGLKFLIEADTRSKAETKAQAKVAAAEDENRRKLYSALPSDLQLATVAADPEAAEFFAQVDKGQAAEIQAAAKRSLETKLLKEEKALSDLTAVKTTASNNVTADQTSKLLTGTGFGGHSFEKWGFLGKDQPEKFAEFNVAIDQQLLDLMDTAASKSGGGVRLNKHELVELFKQKATNEGVIDVDENGDVNNVDMTRIGDVFKSIEAEVIGQPAEQTPQRSQQTGRRVIKFKGN